jgi:hypothetical protein
MGLEHRLASHWSMPMSIFTPRGLHDRQVRVPQGIENSGLAPHETIDGKEIRTLADIPEESRLAADQSFRMGE